MRTRELSRWMKQLGALTPHQRDQLLCGLQALTATNAVAEVLQQRETDRSAQRTPSSGRRVAAWRPC